MRRTLVTFTLVMVFSLSQYAAQAQFKVSAKDEIKLGTQASEEFDKKARLVRGTQLDRVNRVASRLIAAQGKSKYKFSFKVVSDKVVNAFAFPGGFVYVNTGLINMIDNDDELAGVLAHEMTHVQHRHWARQYEKSMNRRLAIEVLLGATKAGKTADLLAGVALNLTDLRYSRKDEQDADNTGIRLLEKAGYEPKYFVTMLQKLKKAGGGGGPAWLSDHPDTDQRIKNAQKYVDKR